METSDLKKTAPDQIEWEITGLGHDLLRDNAHVHLASKKDRKRPQMVTVHLHLRAGDKKGRKIEDAIRARARDILRSALEAL